MSLHLGGVYQAGADALDIGLSDSAIVTNGAGTFVIMTKRRGRWSEYLSAVARWAIGAA